MLVIHHSVIVRVKTVLGPTTYALSRNGWVIEALWRVAGVSGVYG